MFPRRDGAVNIFSSAGRDGKYFSLGDAGRYIFFPRRDGTLLIYFPLSRRKVGAVALEEFPALLIARRESCPEAGIFVPTAVHLTFFFPTGGSNSEKVATRVATSSDSFPPLLQALLLRCQLVAALLVVLPCAVLLLVVGVEVMVEVVAAAVVMIVPLVVDRPRPRDRHPWR